MMSWHQHSQSRLRTARKGKEALRVINQFNVSYFPYRLHPIAGPSTKLNLFQNSFIPTSIFVRCCQTTDGSLYRGVMTLIERKEIEKKCILWINRWKWNCKSSFEKWLLCKLQFAEKARWLSSCFQSGSGLVLQFCTRPYLYKGNVSRAYYGIWYIRIIVCTCIVHALTAWSGMIKYV